MKQTALLLLGGAIGTGCRYLLSTWIYTMEKQPLFPYGTFVVNVTGSFLIGLLAEWLDTRILVSPTIRVALLTGLLGGYTTFSSFEFETLSLLRDGEHGIALLYVGGSVLLGLLAVWAGMRLAHQL